MRQAIPVTVGFCLLAAAWVAVPAQGAIVSGTEDFESVDEGWDATVEYSVYAPGGYPGTHQDKADSYIYVYQVFNQADSTTTLSSFSVGLDDGADAANPGYDDSYGTGGGQPPLLSRLVGDPPTSVAWTIDIAPDEHTTALLYSSPYSWQWKSATVADGGDGIVSQLPSPIPEPATLGLLGIGGLGVLLRRRRS